MPCLTCRCHGYGILLVLSAALAVVAGCLTASDSEVVVYTALDREFSEPILHDFEQQTDIKPLAKYDVESTKTVGLVTEIIAEQERARCDVFWNNEIMHTLRLERMGLLAPVQLPAAQKYPEAFRSPDGLWHGFAARARVLIVNTDLLAEDERPGSVLELADPKWKGRAGIALPLFGTTATHAAVLFSRWGEEKTKEFFRTVKENAEVLTGNKQVATTVSRGQLAFGLTDTDDAIVEIEQGMPVTIVYPDQQEDQMGALLIPNTLCLIKGSANPEAGRRLLEYLLTPEVEERLAKGASAQIPLHADAEVQPRVLTEPVRWMDVDFHAAADVWEPAVEFLSEEFADK